MKILAKIVSVCSRSKQRAHLTRGPFYAFMEWQISKKKFLKIHQLWIQSGKFKKLNPIVETSWADNFTDLV